MTLPAELRLAQHPTRLRQLGRGPRPILALHCSLAHGGAWGAMALDLEQDATLFAPDFPGHGASPAPDRLEDLHDLSTKMAIDLAERIAGGAPIDIFGHSFGGTVALRLALERPDLVRSLTLFEPVMFALLRQNPSAALPVWMAEQQSVDRLIQAGDHDAAAELFHGMWGHGVPLSRMPEAQRRYITERIVLIPATNPVLWDDCANMIGAGRLETITAPTLLVEGAQSPPIIAAVMEALAPRLPNAQRLKLAAAGHMLPLTHSEILRDHLIAHLGQPAMMHP